MFVCMCIYAYVSIVIRVFTLPSNTHKNFHTILWKCNLQLLLSGFVFISFFLHFTVKVIKNTNRKQTENANKANGNKATII